MVKWVSDCPNPKVKSAGKVGLKFCINNKKNLKILQGVNGHLCKLQSNQGSYPYYTVIDNGATQCLIANEHWVISKKYDSWIGVESTVGPNSTTTLWLVDVYSTLVDDFGNRITIYGLIKHCTVLVWNSPLSLKINWNIMGLRSIVGQSCLMGNNALLQRIPRQLNPSKSILDGMVAQSLFWLPTQLRKT